MRADKDLMIFLGHLNWYTFKKNIGYIPTEEAPEEAKKAMQRYNLRCVNEETMSKSDFIIRYRNGENLRCPECGGELKYTHDRKTTRLIYCEKCGFEIYID